MSGIEEPIQGIVSRYELVHLNTASWTSNTTNFALWHSIGQLNATETNRDATAKFTGVLRGIQAFVLTNAKDGATTIAFRKNAATPTGASVSVPANTTGEFNSGSIAIPIIAADLIDVLYDTSASTDGDAFLGLYVRAFIDISSWS